jgi:hypothetical protein
MTSAPTTEQLENLAKFLGTHQLSSGLGTKRSPCSIAAINLFLTGELTDKIPDCMSLVIGKWIIIVQDEMPDEIRNSKEWKVLLLSAVGTGRGKEQERAKIALDWMWNELLPLIQPIANENGFGDEWRQMLLEKNGDAGFAAQVAAGNITLAASAAYHAAAADAAVHATAYSNVAYHVANATDRVANYAAWLKINPVGLLRKLIEVQGE